MGSAQWGRKPSKRGGPLYWLWCDRCCNRVTFVSMIWPWPVMLPWKRVLPVPWKPLMKRKPCMHFKYHVSFHQISLIYFPILAWSPIILSRYLSNGWKTNNHLLFLTRLTVPPGLYSLHLVKDPKSWPEEQQQNFTNKTFNKHFKFTFFFLFFFNPDISLTRLNTTVMPYFLHAYLPWMNKTLKIKPVFWIISQPPAP